MRAQAQAQAQVEPAVAAAGLLLQRTDGQVLLVHRSASADSSQVWGIPGGYLESGEEATTGVQREATYELGPLPSYAVVRVVPQPFDDGSIYTTVVASIPTETVEDWSPRLNWENSEWGWFSVDQLPRPLHTGVMQLLQRQASFKYTSPRMLRIFDDQMYRLVRVFSRRDVAEAWFDRHYDPDRVSRRIVTRRIYSGMGIEYDLYVRGRDK